MLWRRSYDVPPPPIDGRRRVLARRGDPRYAGLGADDAARPSASRTSSRGCCPTGRTRSCRTCATARRCWSPRTATRCAPWSSTSTGSPTTTSPALNIPTGMPLRLRARRRLPAGHARRRVPRPRGRRRGRRSRRQPGPLSAARAVSARTATRRSGAADALRSTGAPRRHGPARCGQFGVLAGDQVDDPVRDRDRVVGEPLVVAADAGSGRRPTRCRTTSFVEQRRRTAARCSSSMSSSSFSRLSGGLDVLAGDDRAGLGDDALGDLAHLQDRGRRIGGTAESG